MPTGDEAPEDGTTPTAPGVSARTIGRSAAWAAGTNIVMRFAGIAVTALLARLLSKEDFGVFAIALAVFLVVGSLAELGLGSAIARAADAPDDFAPTVVTLSVATSAGLGVAMALGAGPLATLLGEPMAEEPIRILSLSLVLTGLFAVPGAQLVREFRQERVFAATVAGFLVSNPLLIVLALNGGDATAFAWSRVVGQLVTGLVMWAGVSKRYWPGWRPDKVRWLVAFGLPLAIANLVNWSLLNADYVIIGRVLGAEEVGIYVIAFNVANWSTAVLNSVLNSVVVPAFGRVSGDAQRLGAALVTATQAVGLVALPIGALTAVLASPLVRTVFGASWSESGPVLTVLSIYGVCYAFSLLLANVLVATARTTALLGIQAVWVATLVPAMLWGLEVGGLVGAAWAHVVTILAVALPGYAYVALRATGQRLSAPLASLTRPALAAAAAALVAGVTATLIDLDWVALLVGGSLGSVTYLLVTLPLLRRAFAEIRASGTEAVETAQGVDA